MTGCLDEASSSRPCAGGTVVYFKIADGRLVLRGSVTLFGTTISANAVLLAQDGRLKIAPDVPFGGFATLTVFADPHVHVDGVGARAVSGGFVVTAQGRLTG